MNLIRFSHKCTRSISLQIYNQAHSTHEVQRNQNKQTTKCNAAYNYSPKEKAHKDKGLLHRTNTSQTFTRVGSHNSNTISIH